MSNIINDSERKMWKYYGHRAKNFPTIPKRVQKLLFKPTKEDRNDPLNWISLRGFRKRVKNYLNQHLHTQLTTMGGTIEEFKYKPKS